MYSLDLADRTGEGTGSGSVQKEEGRTSRDTFRLRPFPLNTRSHTCFSISQLFKIPCNNTKSASGLASRRRTRFVCDFACEGFPLLPRPLSLSSTLPTLTSSKRTLFCLVVQREREQGEKLTYFLKRYPECQPSKILTSVPFISYIRISLSLASNDRVPEG